MHRWLGENKSAPKQEVPEDEQGYIPAPPGDALSVDESLRRAEAVRRRERWERHILLLYAGLLLLMYVIVSALTQYEGIMAFVLFPIAGFFVGWWIIREAVALLSGY